MKVAWFAAVTKVVILKTELLAGNDHVIDIFIDMRSYEKYLTVYFQYLTVHYIINRFMLNIIYHG